MKILVYGAGGIGSLYAARLKDGGHELAILARGQRLQELREHGIRLEAPDGQRTTTRVEVVEELAADDAYDLVLVVLPKHSVTEVLPILAANATPSVMFFGNNAAGPHEMVEALGRSRVLLGFPGAAAVEHDGYLRYVVLSKQEQATTIGELDGERSTRLEAIHVALEESGFPALMCKDMDAWLKTHVAKISPTANALYMAGCDLDRLLRTRDAQVLMVRAMREALGVLNALGIPITPSNHKVIRWLPEPLLLWVMKLMLGHESMNIKIGHASHAQTEMQMIADEFAELAKRAGVATPNMDKLRSYLGDAQPAPDGSSDISVNWRPVLFASAVVLGAGVAWRLLR